MCNTLNVELPCTMIKIKIHTQTKDKTNVIDGHAPVEGKVQVIARSTLKVGHSAGGINSCISDLSK